MGCDIHIYPEYYVEDSDSSEARYVHSICSDYCIGRSYTLFNIMAGVRGSGGFFYPKGLPNDPSPGWTVEGKLSLTVVPDDQPKHDSCIHRSVFENWQQSGTKTIITKKWNNKDGAEYLNILNPDYHTHSWMTFEELLEVRKLYLIEEINYNYESYDLTKKDTSKYRNIFKKTQDPFELFAKNFGPFEYTSLNGLLGMMFAMQQTRKEVKTRIVFWFDS